MWMKIGQTLGFYLIKKDLHFVDNDSIPTAGQEGYKRLGKVQPVIDEGTTSDR